MIHRAIFYLNKNKLSVYDAANRCAALCMQHGIEPVFFSEDRAEIEQHMPACAGCRFLPAPDPAQVDIIFVFGGDGTVLRALDLMGRSDLARSRFLSGNLRTRLSA